jgi:competence protein ComEA
LKKAFLRLWKEYFNFTKGERNAFFVLLVLILLASIYPMLDVDVFKDYPADFSKLEAKTLPTGKDSMDEQDPQGDFQEYPDKKDKFIRERFSFDPNTASVAQLESLGFRSYIARRIEKYRASGGRFRVKGDLLKVYGIDQALVRNLWQEISLPENIEREYTPKTWEKKEYAPKATALIDINTADTSQLISLPGIGSKLAKRIVEFRNKLGGFYSLDQLKEVYGLKPETINMVLPKLSLDISAIQYISINDVDMASLDAHPYISRAQAAAIVEYRKQHGEFRSMNDLEKVRALDEKLLNKVKNYIKF